MACTTESKYFGIVLRNCPIVCNAIKVFNISSKIYIFVWNSTKVFIYETECLGNTIRATSDKEELHFKRPIVDIFSLDGKLYAADISGVILELENDGNELSSENDMFDSPEIFTGWKLKKLGVLNQCDKILAVHTLGNKVTFCVVYNDKLYLHVCRIDPLRHISSTVVDDILPKKVILASINAPLSKELKKRYFPFLPDEDTDILLIGLSTGVVFSLILNDPIEELKTLFSCTQQIVSINCVYDKHGQSCTAISIQLLCGATVVLNDNKSQVMYLPGPVYIAVYNSLTSVYVTSDGVDCCFIKSHREGNDDYECSVSPVKGIRCLCAFPGSQPVIFVATQNRNVYWLDLTAQPIGDPYDFVMPEDGLLDALLSSTTCLDKVCEKMERENSIIQAVSLTKRAQSLSHYFSIFAKVYTGSHNTENKLKVRIETSCDFVNFTSDIWKLRMCVLSSNGLTYETFIKNLQNPLKNDSPIMTEVKCSLAVGTELSCHLIADVEVDQPWLIFPLGKITFDAGYFLTPISNAPCIGKLASLPSLIQNCDRSFVQHDTVLGLHVNSTLINNKLFQVIFCNSSHRMSKQRWLSLEDGDTTMVKAMVNEDCFIDIKLEKSSNTLKISSNKIQICHLVRQAILSRLCSSSYIQLDPKIYLETEAVRQLFELEKLKADWNLKTFKNLKDSVRNGISRKLPT